MQIIIKFTTDITIDGTLITSNLNVIGGITEINTANYVAENLTINNDEGTETSFIIKHNNVLNNIIEIDNNNSEN